MPVHRQAVNSATQVCRESVVVITAAIMVVIVLIVLIVVAVVVVVVAAAATTSIVPKLLETCSTGQSLVRRPENEPQDKAKDNYNR